MNFQCETSAEANVSTEVKSTMDCEVDPAIQALLPNYIRRREADVEAIEQLLNHGDFTEVRRLAHNMRGSGRAYGFPSITEIGASMEEASLAEDKELLGTLVKELATLVKQMRG